MPNELWPWRVVSAGFFFICTQVSHLASPLKFSSFSPAFWHFKSNYCTILHMPSKLWDSYVFSHPSPRFSIGGPLRRVPLFLFTSEAPSLDLSATSGRMFPQRQPQPQPQPMISRTTKPGGSNMTRGGDESMGLLFCFCLCFCFSSFSSSSSFLSSPQYILANV